MSGIDPRIQKIMDEQSDDDFIKVSKLEEGTVLYIETNNNVYVDTGAPVTGRGLLATIAVQNQVNVDGADGDAEPSFAGEVGVAACQVPGIVECAPANSKTVNALVVTPRNSDGTNTTAQTRKRVYVQVSE